MIKLFYKKDKIQLIFDQNLRTLKEKREMQRKNIATKQRQVLICYIL